MISTVNVKLFFLEKHEPVKEFDDTHSTPSMLKLSHADCVF